jgi:hypothetical protein
MRSKPEIRAMRRALRKEYLKKPATDTGAYYLNLWRVSVSFMRDREIDLSRWPEFEKWANGEPSELDKIDPIYI